MQEIDLYSIRNQSTIQKYIHNDVPYMRRHVCAKLITH
jgi:hypothetical protein